jgi:cytochrome c-type biogenesis protein CcmH
VTSSLDVRQGRKERIRPYVLLAALLAAGSAFGEDPGRARRIQERLMAPCCWSESVALHRSEAALEMKRQIEQLIAQGKTDTEIVAVFTARYGQRILVEPEGGTGAMLTAIPVGAVALGVVITALIIRRLRRPVTPAASPAGNAPVELPDDFDL